MAAELGASDRQGFACRLTDREMAKRKEDVSRLFGQRANSVVSTESDVEFVFNESETVLADIVEFIRLERECCPFLAWKIEISPDGGPLKLAIGGSPEKRAFFEAEMGDAFPTLVVRRA